MKTWKQIQAQLAREFNLPLLVVESHTNAYWEEIKNRISKPTGQLVRVMGLGSWQVTQKKLFKQMAAYLIDLRRIKLGVVPTRAAKVILAETAEQFPRLWRLKQSLGWINYSTKPGPSQVVKSRYSTKTKTE